MSTMKMKAGMLAMCLFCAAQAQANEPVSPRQDVNALDARALIYGYDEMFEFDIPAWLARRAPHLLPYSESISHWAGYSGISPKVLIALMEQQSGIVSTRGIRRNGLDRPFGALSKKVGFNAQTMDIAQALRQSLYAPEHASRQAAIGPVVLSKANPLQVLRVSAGEGLVSAAINGDVGFQQAYASLFNEPRRTKPINQQTSATVAGDVSTRATSFYLQFPFQINQTWTIGGAHTSSGSGTFPMNAIDMWKSGGWGSNQSANKVVASALGTFKKHSSCLAEITHADGWSTQYYHLMNITFATGATVNRNAQIGNPANTLAQATCSGGFASGPHVHWALKKNGSDYHLTGVSLGGYVITANGTSNYDTNCTRFYLTKNGAKSCAGPFLSQ